MGLHTILLHFYSPERKDCSIHICIISTWCKVIAQQMCFELNCYYYLPAEK